MLTLREEKSESECISAFQIDLTTESEQNEKGSHFLLDKYCKQTYNISVC
ncbi:hypothetical protein D593_0360 [Streptococcus intermedius BA1]|nr:hypothetical protein D593_0360 [Streptococcus intermedius BA1]